MEIVLLFPHHLFENHPALQKDRLILFVEHPLFFCRGKALFHKQKIVLHRASMMHFEQTLKKKGFKTKYIEDNLKIVLEKQKPSLLHVAELDDHDLEKELKKMAKSLKIPLKVHPSPGFLTPTELFSEIFEGKKQYSFQTFYIEQRKRLGILVDSQLKPIGGKWSYDVENRKKAPKTLQFPEMPRASKSKFVDEAIAYVKKKYRKHPGEVEGFEYPISHSDAERFLENFLKNRLKSFGSYEDAILQDERILFHSVLSPLLNIGLLTPQQVVDETLKHAKSHKIEINSLEGFLRQVIGWREYIRGIYHLAGPVQRKGNYFKHKRKIPKSFYDATTGILPIDTCIKKLQKYAYLHHIERLMLLGNFMLLCEIDPDEVYKWFMEMFIDSYDWVMVPNVYGMSQYADGGRMTTKPYISGSNYVLKMSDYPKGEWTSIWDALFWRFMIKHISLFEKEPRLKMLCNLAKKKKKDRKLISTAEEFLKGLS
ncbi:MAG: cryptochrome/photolyase family protein [Parachlamydiales bacterium]|nr:cryptochrome/photolyase family protein [Parachlamydiales bacterium]